MSFSKMEKRKGRYNRSCLGVGTSGSGKDIRKRYSRVLLERTCSALWFSNFVEEKT
jgi:hypothetical protein